MTETGRVGSSSQFLVKLQLMSDKVDRTRNPRGLPEAVCAGGVITGSFEGQVVIGLIKEGDKSGWVLPKGHLESGEDALTAAYREIEEELGLAAADLVLGGELGLTQREDSSGSEWKTTRFYLFFCPADGDQSRFRGRWFPLDQLPPLYWPDQKKLIERHYQTIIEQLADWKRLSNPT